MEENSSQYHKNNLFHASIKSRYSLSLPGSHKSTHHIVLDLKSSGITYEVGDCVVIAPDNDNELVQKTLEVLGATGEETVIDKLGSTWNFREFLKKKANITEVSKKFITEVCAKQSNPQKKENLEKLLSNEGKEAYRIYQTHHVLWQILKEHHEVSFTPEELTLLLMPLLPRFYSIASSQTTVGDEIHLTVALLKYDNEGHIHKGVCTHFLCEIAPLHQPVVPLYIQPHHGFTLPENNQTPIIMIGPGTGVAPFRGFIQERWQRRAKGKNWLFFGECHRAYDFFYRDLWEELEQQNFLKLTTAFSRDQKDKVYVQHKMLENAQEFYRWLSEEGAYLYVCGDAHHMAKDVESMLLRIIETEGKKSPEEAKAYLKELRTSKRYLRDVY